MDLQELERLLRSYKGGEMGEREAARRIGDMHFEDIGHSRVDHARAARQGFPEVVFGAGKTRRQVLDIFERLAARSPNVLVTRTDADTYGEARNVCTEAEWHESARLIRVWRDRAERASSSSAPGWRARCRRSSAGSSPSPSSPSPRASATAPPSAASPPC